MKNADVNADMKNAETKNADNDFCLVLFAFRLVFRQVLIKGKFRVYTDTISFV